MELDIGFLWVFSSHPEWNRHQGLFFPAAQHATACLATSCCFFTHGKTSGIAALVNSLVKLP